MKENCLELAEKITAFLLKNGYSLFKKGKEIDPHKMDLIFSEALNLTYGEITSITFRNQKGEITAKIYMKPDGTFVDDTWINNLGWNKHK